MNAEVVMTNKRSWILSGCVTLGIVACMWSWLQLSQARAASLDARANLRRMEEVKGHLASLRALESSAHLIGEQPIETTSSWVAYGRSADISESQFAEINRLPMAKIENTPYSRDDVFVRLTNVSAEQIVRFSLECGNASVGYSLLSVHMLASNDRQQDVERWNASLILTRVLYTATTAP